MGGGEVGELRVDVNKIEALGSVRATWGGGRKCRSSRVGDRVPVVGNVSDSALSDSTGLSAYDG